MTKPRTETGPRGAIVSADLRDGDVAADELAATWRDSPKLSELRQEQARREQRQPDDYERALATIRKYGP